MLPHGEVGAYFAAPPNTVGHAHHISHLHCDLRVSRSAPCTSPTVPSTSAARRSSASSLVELINNSYSATNLAGLMNHESATEGNW